MNKNQNQQEDILEVEIPGTELIGLLSPYLYGAKRENFPKALEERIHAMGGQVQAFSLQRSLIGKRKHQADAGVIVVGAELIRHCVAREARFIPLALIPQWTPGQWQVIEYRQTLTLRVDEFEFFTFAWKSDSERQSRVGAITQWAQKQSRPSRLCIPGFAKVSSTDSPVTTEIGALLGLPLCTEPVRLNKGAGWFDNSVFSKLPRIEFEKTTQQTAGASKKFFAKRIRQSVLVFIRDWRLSAPLAIALIGAALIVSGPSPQASVSAPAGMKAAPTAAPTAITKSLVWLEVEDLAQRARENGAQDLQGMRLSRKEASASGYRLAWDWPAKSLGRQDLDDRPKMVEFEIATEANAARAPVLTQQQWQEIAIREGVLLEFSIAAQGWRAAGPAQPIDRINSFLAEVLQPNGSWNSVELRRTSDGLARLEILGAAE